MADITAKDALCGTDVKVWLDGEELGLWTNFEANITINYEDIQIGYDVDRKAVGWQGEGSISNQATNSMGAKLFNKLQKNKDARFVIEGEITKLSTGETQFTRLVGCTFDSLPLAVWAKGEVWKNEMSFRFLPSASVINELIQ